MCDTSSDNDSEIEETSSNNHIRREAGAMCKGVVPEIPERSKHSYNRAFTKFMKWKVSKNNESLDEDVVLAYFKDLADKFKPSSLWTAYSMLKSTLMLNNEVDISRYSRVLAFLREKAQISQEVKKSKTFTPEEVNRFLKEAHNNEHLLEKVVLIFGVVGSCRRYELYNLLFTDVEVYSNKILVKIHNTLKPTPATKKYRVFTVTGTAFELCKKYISLRPKSCKITTFFIQYRDGKCRDHPVGINQLGNLSKSIARFLELPDPEAYTGHSFKRTSTKLLVYSEGDAVTVKEYYDMGAATLPAPEGNNTMQSSYNSKAEIRSRIDKSTTTPENDSNRLLNESNVNMSNQFPNMFDNQDFECVNINIPSGNFFDGYASDSVESKSRVWNEIQNTAVNKKNVGDMSTSLNLSDCNPFQDSLRSNTNKILNINVPDTSANSNIQESVSALVHFNNCKIQNVNINYTK